MIRSICFALCAGLLLTSCTKDPIRQVTVSPPVEKKVVYQVFAAKDYSHPIYDNVQATVTLTVGAVDNKTGNFTKLWDTAMNGHLRSFPLSTQKIQVEKTFTLVESAEKLQLAYAIRYNDNGQINQTASFEPVPAGTNRFLMSVDL